MKYSYPCILEPEDDEKYKGWFNVSFPDLEGPLTCGCDWKTAMIMAEDCMVVSLASYVDRQKEPPTPSAWAKGQEIMTVQPLIAAQLDLYQAMREQGVTNRRPGTASEYSGGRGQEATQLGLQNFHQRSSEGPGTAGLQTGRRGPDGVNRAEVA